MSWHGHPPIPPGSAPVPLPHVLQLTCPRPGMPHDALLRARVAPGLQLGQADGPGKRPPALLQRMEVGRPGRRVLRGAEGGGLAEAAQPASHGPAILEATLGGNAGPRQEAAEQAVGLAVEPVRDGAGAEVR